MTEAAFELPPELLAALTADLAVPGRWRMVAAHPTLERTSTPNVDPLQPPVEAVARHVTATLVCQARGISLIFMLEGPDGAPPTSLLVSYGGQPWRTDDAALIARIANAVEPHMANKAAELVAKLGEPLP